MVVSGSECGKVEIWSLKPNNNKNPVAHFKAHYDAIVSIKFFHNQFFTASKFVTLYVKQYDRLVFGYGFNILFFKTTNLTVSFFIGLTIFSVC